MGLRGQEVGTNDVVETTISDKILTERRLSHRTWDDLPFGGSNSAKGLAFVSLTSFDNQYVPLFALQCTRSFSSLSDHNLRDGREWSSVLTISIKASPSTLVSTH